MDNLKLIAMVDQVQLQSYDEKSVSWSGIIWGKVFKNGPSKICRRQPLKDLRGYIFLGYMTFSNAIISNLPNS